MKIIFCLPGKQFSGKFIRCWSTLLVFAVKSGIECYVRNLYSSNVYHGRNLILSEQKTGNVEQHMYVKPLETTGYDYTMWIDSDMTFKPADFRKLIEYDRPIVGGIARMGPKGQIACGNFLESGEIFFHTEEGIKNVEKDESGLVKVDWTGFAFLCIKNGVFESMPYPWFRPMTRVVDKHLFFPSEDVGFCILAKKYGWDIFVDPEMKIGHEKSVVL